MWLKRLYQLSGLTLIVLVWATYIMGFILGEKSLTFLTFSLAFLVAILKAIIFVRLKRQKKG